MEEKIEQTDKEQEIDLLDLVRKLWNGRKLILNGASWVLSWG